MPSNKDKYISETVKQCEVFRKGELGNPSELVDWLGLRIKGLSEKITGTKTRSVEDTSASWATKIEVCEGEPYIVFLVDWCYKGGYTKPAPDVEAVSHCFQNLKLIANGNQEEMLSAEIRLNANHWEAYVPYVLYEKVHFSLTAKHGYPEVRKEFMREALVLSEYFYTGMTEDFLHMGLELGMLEDLETFNAWCPPAIKKANIVSAELPLNIEIC